jgi:hypothetical protein
MTALDRAAPGRLWWNLERREAAMLAAILAATALVYLPSIGNGFVWDDWLQIVDADLIHRWSGVGRSFVNDAWWFQDPTHLPKSAYYRPMQATWFGLNYMIFGDRPAVWHAEKIVLELIGVMLSFRLAQLLTRNSTVALLTAAIFGLLPANAEAVVWASAIGEPLSTICEMGALCCLIGRKPGSSRAMVSALMLYAVAMLSHETAILFGAIVAAYVFLIERKSVCESMRLATPFIVVAIAYLFMRLNALGTTNFFGLPYFQDISVSGGWAAPVPPRGARELILTAPVVLLAYLGVLIVPGMAAPAHDVHWITSASASTFVAAGILVMLAAIASVAVWRSSCRNLYLFCTAWSLLALAPSMRLTALATLVEDRLLYAPSFGWSLAFALAIMQLAAAAPRARVAIAGAMALLLAAYAVAIVRAERYWHDDETFFAYCEELDPHDADYLRVRVTLMNQQGDFTSALNVLQHAEALDPENSYIHLKLAKQYSLLQRGQDAVSEIETTRALWAKERAARSTAAKPSP